MGKTALLKNKLFISILVVFALTTSIAVTYAINNNLKPESTSECFTITDETAETCLGSVLSAIPTTGQRITIIGNNFPYRSVNDYVHDSNSDGSDDLVVHFDGINNVGLGDDQHSANSTTWKNLTSDYNVTFNGTTTERDNGWKYNGFKFPNTNAYFTNTVFPTGTPTGGTERTVEVVFTTPANQTEFDLTTETGNADMSAGLFSYGPAIGNSTCGATYFGVGYLGTTAAENMGTTGNYIPTFTPIMGCGGGFDYIFRRTASADLVTYNRINSSSSTYVQNSTPHSNFTYVNGVSYPDQTTWAYKSPLATPTSGSFNIGTYSGHNYVYSAKNFTINSIRLYNKVLSQEQIKQNAKVDQIRFKAKPVITINGAECTNLVVESKYSIQCDAPAMSSNQYNLEMVYDSQTATLVNGAKYADPTISSISPNRGTVGGGQKIIINGANFPYSSTDEYNQTGLKALYDGVNNIGLGDEVHSNTSTTWVDLSGHNMDATLVQKNTYCGGELSYNNNLPSNTLLSDGSTIGATGTGFCGDPFDGTANWLNNGTISAGFHFPRNNNIEGNKFSFQVPPSIWKNVIAKGNEPYNIEFIYTADADTQKTAGMAMNGFVFWGRQCATSGVGVLTNVTSAFDINFYRCGVDSYHKFQNNAIFSGTHSLSISWGGTGTKMQAIRDGVEVATCTSSCTQNNNIDVFEPLQIGKTRGYEYGTGYTLLGLRIYDHALSPNELAKNFAVDKIRYTSKMNVKIGNNACTDVVILSTTKASCTVPASTTSLGSVSVSVGLGDSTSDTALAAYEYVDASALVVNSYTPNIAPQFAGSLTGGEIKTLTISGANLGTVTSVKVGGTVCGEISVTADTVTCKIPSGNVGYADITLFASDQIITTLTSAIKYIGASKNPISYKVVNSSTGTNSADYFLTGTAGVDSLVEIEETWDGINKVVINYPTGLVAPAIPYGWTGAVTDGSGFKILTLESTVFKSADLVSKMISNLVWTSTTSTASNSQGSISVQLFNGLW